MPFEFDDERILSIGAFLRKVREDKELSQKDAAEATRIHLRFIEAIEEDDEEAFPDPPYRDLFTKSYADFLGVPLEEVLLRLPEKTAPKPRDRKTKTSAPTQKPPSGQRQETEARTKPGRGLRLPGMFRIPVYGALLATIVLLTYVIFFNGEEEQDIPGSLPTMAVDSAGPRVATQGASETPDSLHLLLIAGSECWLGVRTDGDSVYSNTLFEDDTVRFAMQDSVSLRLGKANAVSAWLNGLPLHLVDTTDSAAAGFFITQDNYSALIDSSRLVK